MLLFTILTVFRGSGRYFSTEKLPKITKLKIQVLSVKVVIFYLQNPFGSDWFDVKSNWHKNSLDFHTVIWVGNTVMEVRIDLVFPITI